MKEKQVKILVSLKVCSGRAGNRAQDVLRKLDEKRVFKKFPLSTKLCIAHTIAECFTFFFSLFILRADDVFRNACIYTTNRINNNFQLYFTTRKNIKFNDSIA